MGFAEDCAADREQLELLRRFRRDLHRIPELDFELPRTIAYIEDVLAPLACEVTHPCTSCVCAFFDVGALATTAIRADMDALPITEATGCEFASVHAGRMHACGHDAHMAMALATAVWLDGELRTHPDSVPRNVLFVFQPAEETTGGASSVCASGVFERYRVDRIFGFHVWPDLPAGTVASCPGPLLARASETHVTIRGASTHIAKTYGVADADSRDAALAAARFFAGVREVMARLAAEEPCLCSFGVLEAGSVCNAVAASARLEGSLRVFSDAMFVRAKDELRALLDRVCAGCGCAGDIAFAEGYPPVVNDPALYRLAATAVAELARIREPLLIAEDFAFYQRHLPGLFLLLGVGEPEGAGKGTECALSDGAQEGSADLLGYAPSALHTDTFLFDERLLLPGLAVYRRLLHCG